MYSLHSLCFSYDTSIWGANSNMLESYYMFCKECGAKIPTDRDLCGLCALEISAEVSARNQLENNETVGSTIATKKKNRVILVKTNDSARTGSHGDIRAIVAIITVMLVVFFAMGIWWLW